MIVSMTGFATKTVTLTMANGETVVLTCNLKSLNSRFFESNCKIPYILSYLETDFVRLFKKRLKRGHVFLSITANNQSLLRGMVVPSLSMVEAYLTAADVIKEKFSLNGTLSITDVMQLPNIFSTEEQKIDTSTKDLIMQTMDELVDALIQTRTIEGGNIKADFDQRHTVLQSAITHIEKDALVLMEQRKEEVVQTMRELGIETSKEAESQRMALYNELNRIDIHEEIIRFKSHLQNLKKVLTSDKLEKGKHIDFILQELTREANTIAAKAPSASISSQAVTIKVELEKIREQAQNIV